MENKFVRHTCMSMKVNIQEVRSHRSGNPLADGAAGTRDFGRQSQSSELANAIAYVRACMVHADKSTNMMAGSCK